MKCQGATTVGSVVRQTPRERGIGTIRRIIKKRKEVSKKVYKIPGQERSKAGLSSTKLGFGDRMWMGKGRRQHDRGATRSRFRMALIDMGGSCMRDVDGQPREGDNCTRKFTTAGHTPADAVGAEYPEWR